MFTMDKLNKKFQSVVVAASVLTVLSCLSITCCEAADLMQRERSDGKNSNPRYRQQQMQRRALDGKTAKAKATSSSQGYYADSGYYASNGGMKMLSGEGSKAAKTGEVPMVPTDDDDDDTSTAATVTGMKMTSTLPTWAVGEDEHILDQVTMLEQEEEAATNTWLPPAHDHENPGWDDDESAITSKAGKGTKSAKAKSAKAKSAKGELPPIEGADDDAWNYHDDAWAGSAADDALHHDDAWAGSTADDAIVAPVQDDAIIPCGTKAGKDCPPTLMPIPPIEWIPSAPPRPIDGAPAPSPSMDWLTMAPTPCIGNCASLPPIQVVIPPPMDLLTMAPTPCVGNCASLPPIQVVIPTTAPPVVASTMSPSSIAAPPTASSSSSAPPVGLIPITVSPVSEAPFPTYSPTGMPSTTLQSLTKELHPPTTTSSTSLDGVVAASGTGGTWFQTGKSYDMEVTQYARSRVSGADMQSFGAQDVRDRDEDVPLLVQDGSGHAVQEVGGSDNHLMMMEDSASSSSSSSGGFSSSRSSSNGERSRSVLLSWMVLCGGGLAAVAYSLL